MGKAVVRDEGHASFGLPSSEVRGLCYLNPKSHSVCHDMSSIETKSYTKSRKNVLGNSPMIYAFYAPNAKWTALPRLRRKHTYLYESKHDVSNLTQQCVKSDTL